MGFNVNYEINAAADAVMIVYELTKRVGNPTRRVRAKGPTPLAVWRLRRLCGDRESIPMTGGGETEGFEHMAVTKVNRVNAQSISLAQVEADFDPHVAARARRSSSDPEAGNQEGVVRRCDDVSDMPESFTNPSDDGRRQESGCACESRQLQRTMINVYLDGSRVHRVSTKVSQDAHLTLR